VPFRVFIATGKTAKTGTMLGNGITREKDRDIAENFAAKRRKIREFVFNYIIFVNIKLQSPFLHFVFF